MDLGFVLNLNLCIWVLCFGLCCGACLFGGETEESYAGFWFSRNGIEDIYIFFIFSSSTMADRRISQLGAQMNPPFHGGTETPFLVF